MRLNKTIKLLREYFSRGQSFIYNLAKPLKLSKHFIQNQRGVSLVEIIVFSSIFLFFVVGTSRIFITTLKTQSLKHSKTSELNLRKLLEVLNQQACTNTFSGKNIGEDIAHIRDENGIPLISTTSSFKKNFQIMKIDTAPRVIPCNSIQASSAGDCPPGCTYPGSPGLCSGTHTSHIPGYAELRISFSRPGSLFETKTHTGVCNTSDQSHCYKQNCIMKLTGSPDRGDTGEAIGACELLDCNEELSNNSTPDDNSCYTVTDNTGHLKKATLIGCGTTQDITIDNFVAFGFNTGSANLTMGTSTTLIGYKAGEKSETVFEIVAIGKEAGNLTGVGNTSSKNTFIGFETGKNSSNESSSNTFIGHKTGTVNKKRFNTFIGHQAGKNDQAGNSNTFIGYQTGFLSSRDFNTFIGHLAGYQHSGTKNTFIGNSAGKENSGDNNTLIGNSAGLKNQGDNNTLIGNSAGKENSGENNVFIGKQVGTKNQGNENVFIGEATGENNDTGKNNTFIGSYAGEENTTGENNIFIGYKAASDPDYNSKDNRFVIGNINNPTWITAEIGTDDFKVKGTKVSYEGHTHLSTSSTSSRTLKKNIKAFKNLDKALDDILNTPLFTFEFKKELPQKSRIGFISEELPPHLQIKDKPSRPDMVSIRGTILAAIKALYKKMINLKEEIPSQIKNLKTEILKELSENKKQLKEEIFQQLKDLSKSLETMKEELSLEVKTKEHISHQKRENLIQEQKKKRDLITKELQKTKKELSQAKADLAYTKAEMESTKKQIKLLGEKLNALK